MAQDRRKFIAKEVREEESKVCYEIWIDHTLLCVVWISAEQRTTHGSKTLEEWRRRHEESLKKAGIAGVDLTNEMFMGARPVTSRAR